MTMNEPTPRRSLVPGPPDHPARTAAAQAIAAREAQALQPGVGRPLSSPEVFSRRDAPVGNLAKAIASVMANVGTIEQRGVNRHHNYKYAVMGDVLHALTPLIGKAGLAIFQNEIEIKTVESRVAVTYEFSIAHESGETWPEKPRFTGMANAKNANGTFDDKAINKAHSAARKYFLLSLFQVPAGDFDEADADQDANQRQEKAPVPGPPQRTAHDQAAQQAAQASAKAAESGIPHKIVLGQGAGADQWATTFIKAIGNCQSEDEITKWDAANDTALQSMSQYYPEVYGNIEAAVARRLSDLRPATEVKAGLGNGSGMPDPKEDPGEAMQWVAAQLAQLKSWEGAKAFWNQYVAPRDKDFDESDWSMLMEEWKRAELRLAPPDDQLPEQA